MGTLTSRRADAAVLVGAAVLLGVAVLRGQVLADRGATLILRGAAPLTGPLREGLPPPAYLGAVAAGVVGLVVLPTAARRLRWLHLLLLSVPAAVTWALALGATDGRLGLFERLSTRHEYLFELDRVVSPLVFLEVFVSRVPLSAEPDNWATHVSGHPPGVMLLFWWLREAGLGGEVRTALVMVLAGAAAVPAALVVARVLAGEAVARTAAPFLVLAPYAVWVATSADAAFLGFSAWGVALLLLAAEARGPRSDLLALGGGGLLGSALFLSYGVAPLGLVPLVGVLVVRRSARAAVRPLAVAAAAVLTVAVAYGVSGFVWTEGLAVTVQRVADGAAGSRPRGYFLLANATAASVALGPAVLVGLRRLVPAARARAVPWPLAAVVGAGVLTLTASTLSGLSKGEVERIWLPFYPWLVLACVLLTGRDGRVGRGWLAAQVVTALVVQAVLVGKW